GRHACRTRRGSAAPWSGPARRRTRGTSGPAARPTVDRSGLDACRRRASPADSDADGRGPGAVVVGWRGASVRRGPWTVPVVEAAPETYVLRHGRPLS